ncbi:MAG: bifunctional nuclease family protein [Candidatus Poribacteria bacterium]|nr:bifunctional nuclease family protein [Candidatus Poribacteria bacterium]
MVQVNIEFVTVDPNSRIPVVVLKEKEGESKRILLIWIGESEAWAIDNHLKQVHVPRPMTHDLLKSVIDTFSVKVSSVCITAIEDITFYAQVTLELNGEVHEIDSRPSDALALAIRSDVPIFVEEEVLEENGFIEKESSGGNKKQRNAKDVLENLDDEIAKHYTV